MWLRLYLLEDCFPKSKGRTHLGLEFEGEWYCITHYNSGVGVHIPKRCLKMIFKTKKEGYLKKLKQVPKVKKMTEMAIDESLLVYYDELNIKNINNAYKKSRLRDQASRRKN